MSAAGMTWRAYAKSKGISTPWIAAWESVGGHGTDEWTPEDFATFTACTGLEAPRPGGHPTAYKAVGRRGSKSYAAAAYSSWHMQQERGMVEHALGAGNVTVVLQDARAGENVFLSYVRDFLEQDGALEAATADTLASTSGNVFRVLPCSPKAMRAWKSGLVILDEWDHYLSTDARNLSDAVLRAARPQLFGIKTGRIAMLSSPNGVGGAMHRAFEKHYGKPGDTLFWRASALVMRPDLLDDPQMVALRDDDPAGFDQEVLAEFTAATGSLIEPSKLEQCVTAATVEPAAGDTATFDVGGRRDGTAGIIGRSIRTPDGRTVVLVTGVWHWPAPHLPEDAIQAFARVLKAHGISRVYVDRGKDDLTRLVFQEAGITVQAPVGTTSENHEALARAIENGRMSLPRHQALLRELRGLRRIKGGVTHTSSGHDDIAAAVSHLAAVLVQKGGGSTYTAASIFGREAVERRFGKSKLWGDSFCEPDPDFVWDRADPKSPGYDPKWIG